VNHGKVNLTAASKLAKGKRQHAAALQNCALKSFPQKPSSIHTSLLVGWVDMAR
jgi:hypothetical protein